MGVCALLRCVNPTMAGSVWCEDHDIRKRGDSGYLEPLRDRRGVVVHKDAWRGAVKPSLLGEEA